MRPLFRARDAATALHYIARPMTTPQQPRVRNKVKARRSKQLAAWRAKNAEASPKPAEGAGKKTA
jgi:hypothetical protein